MFQIYYHIRVGQTTSLQNKINRARRGVNRHKILFFKKSYISEFWFDPIKPKWLDFDY